MTIQNIFNASLLAQAAYANGLNPGDDGTTLSGKLTNPQNGADGVTNAQGDLIGENFTVVQQQATTSSGFSATLFEDSSGAYYFALRGTDGQGPDWTDANLGNALSGVSKNQIVDMLNFYLRLTTSGPVNQYKYRETYSDTPPIQPHYLLAEATGDPVPLPPKYAVLDVDSTVSGYGAIDSSTPLTITGHSLGGHLASAFRLLFPSVTSEAYTFNSAGFIGWLSDEYDDFATLMLNSVSEMTVPPNAFASGWINTTDITAPADVVSHIGSGHIGGHAFEVQVESLGGATNIIADHSIDRLSDSLAVMNFMATLDPTMTVEKANSIFLAAFNTMAMSLESLMNGFAGLFNQPAISIADSDHDAIYTAIKNITDALEENETFSIALTGAGIANLAQGSSDAARGYRYSLINLLPFAVTSNLQNTAAMDARYNDVYSTKFLEDRALMLGAVLERNVNDSTHPSLINGEAIYFDDRFTGIEVFAGQTQAGNFQDSDVVNIVFDDGSSHALSGGKKDDRLYGNGGDDTFYGNGGNDYLEGGSGQDTYIFDSTLTGGFGIDTIIDCGGYCFPVFFSEQLKAVNDRSKAVLLRSV